MFNNIAPYYDFLNHFLSLGIDRGWRRKAIAMLDAPRYPLIVDIATGTGDVAIAMAQRLPVDQIVGVDIAEEMLELGRAKIRKRNLEDKILLEAGDSENLRFADNSVDAITVAFGVRNFEHVESGLTEMWRVLKPGAQLIILEFSRPRVFPVKQLFNFYFRNILPLIGRITSKDPKAYGYLYESVQAFPDRGAFTDLLNKIGFRETNWQSLTLGICCIYSARK